MKWVAHLRSEIHREHACWVTRVTIPSIDSQLLSTLELLHYSRRFENALFCFSCNSAEHCSTLLMDLRVLIAARIKQVLFCPADAKLAKTLALWSKCGDRFVVLKTSEEDFFTGGLPKRIEEELRAGNAPVVAVPACKEERRRELERRIMEISVSLGARKIFFAGSEPGLIVDGILKGYPTNQQIRDAINSGAVLNMSPERLQFLINEQERHGVDIVLVEARRGAVFEEVFTHGGSGTLLTREYPNVLRAAKEEDVRDIMALLQPYVAEGFLKPVSEEELLTIIRSFMVYSVNGQIVCAATLRDFGDSCELAKLCTLPRFQARGRARALVRALLEQAQKRGKRSVFALTVQSYVGDFFEKLGFVPVDRETLPEDWKAGYDFSRASKAYRYVFSK